MQSTLVQLRPLFGGCARQILTTSDERRQMDRKDVSEKIFL
jgi:hypothetical protein